MRRFLIAWFEPIILACSNAGDLVLDPFAGSGTTCRIAKENGRRFIGIELNPEYAKMAARAVGVSVVGEDGKGEECKMKNAKCKL